MKKRKEKEIKLYLIYGPYLWSWGIALKLGLPLSSSMPRLFLV